MNSQFFNYEYCHIDDGVVSIEDQRSVPFEVLFRFLMSTDTSMVKDASLCVWSTNEVDYQPDLSKAKAHIVVHYLNDESESKVNAAIKEFGGENIKPVEAFLEASRYTTKVVRRENVTHVYWQTYMGGTPSILIKAAFCLKLLCPTLFNGKLTEYPAIYMQAIKEVEKDNFEKCWSKIEPYYIKIKKTKWMADLKNVFVNTYSSQISRIEQQRDNAYEQIERYSSQISQVYKEIEGYNIKINGMLANNQSEKQYDEFVEFLGHINAEIINYVGDGRSFTIQFRGFADNYDIDAATDVIEEERSYMYTSAGENSAALKKLYEEVFINQNYKLCIASNIEIRPTDYYYHAIQINNGTAADIDGVSYLQNPHLRHHNCFGDNQCDIAKAMSVFDYYTAAMYMNAANSNLSFTDSTVMRELGKDIVRNKKKKMFLGKDGKHYSFTDIVKEVNEDGTEAED